MSETPHHLSRRTLRIFSIDVRTTQNFAKKLESYKLKIDNQREFCPNFVEYGSLRLSTTFDPVIEVAPSNHFTVTVHYSWAPWAVWKKPAQPVDISFDPQEILADTRTTREGLREFQKIYKKIVVTVEVLPDHLPSVGGNAEQSQSTSGHAGQLSSASSDAGQSPPTVGGTGRLPSTSSAVLRACPRFRLLVIGKTGVGKSSLIQHAFNIGEVHVSDTTRGEAHIDQEFIAPENERFVLHDSQGFESGDQGNVKIVKDFIARRSNMPELRDRLHAVWLCLATPHANGRLLESGVRTFLESRRDILGNIPIVVVFTKLDLLAASLDREAFDSGEDIDDATLEGRKTSALNEWCVKPLQAAAGSDILQAAVSTEEGYENTIARLLEITTTNVDKYINEAALVAVMAQRRNIRLKIEGSIALGKKRYWSSLASSANFAGHTLWECLHVIHTDIIAVWNFEDPHCRLSSQEFRKEMAGMVGSLEGKPTADPNRTFKFGLSMVATIAGILTPLAGPALPVVVPITAGIALVAWAYTIYQKSHDVLRQFMAYIVDLMCIMQILFLVSPQGPVSPETIQLAVRAYSESEAGKDQVHSLIRAYEPSAALTRAGRDHALEKIIKLINDHRIEPEEISSLRAKIPNLDKLS
ncbi:hypothetical protein BV22DRAFT_153440 [Leucogyrophana mollusca]|uniref:Uncharacterized protein n=1 Tax=Leucogyrophana mollusca TaxID=85980 RepID=A0ACB8BTW0_9AGAM|nr:hypothetical protein BV22DRAFT_153440 [Leucogyrophana mollusca]